MSLIFIAISVALITNVSCLLLIPNEYSMTIWNQDFRYKRFEHFQKELIQRVEEQIFFI